MQRAYRFALAAPDDGPSRLAIAELNGAVAAGGIELDPVFVPTYAALYETLARGRADLGWAPPLVARDLALAAVASPLVAIVRDGSASYGSALIVARDSSIVHLEGLRGARMGWVSKQSAAGYVVPRAFLRGEGLDPSTLFTSETIYGSHTELVVAVATGAVDAGATFVPAGGPPRAGIDPSTRILALAGRVPSDVVVVGADVDPGKAIAVADAFARARLSRDGALRGLMQVDRFAVAAPEHLAALDRWLLTD